MLYFPSGFYIVRRHDRAEAGHGADRAASRHDPARSAGLHARLPGCRHAEGGARGAARRHQHRERPRHLHRRHQSARDGHALDGGRALAHGRRADPRRRRHVSAAGGADRRSTTAGRGGASVRVGPLGRAVSEHLGDARRRRHVRQHLDAEHVRAGRASTCPTRRRPATSTSCRPSITCSTRSSSIASRTGTSTRRRPRKKPPTSPEAVSLEINWSKNITIANYHGYRVTRSHAPFPAAVRIVQLVGHPFPQRARQRRERLRHLRRERLRHVPARRASSRTRTRFRT